MMKTQIIQLLSTSLEHSPERANRLRDRLFFLLCLISLVLPLLVLLAVTGSALVDALPQLNIDFLTSFPSRKATIAGFFPAVIGSLYLIALTAIIAVPVGIGAAIYLQEYAKKNWLTRLIEINIANLAGVPSIIYGLLGLEIFVRAFALNRSLIAGAATLALLILPMIIVAAREALRTVPGSLREGAFALGAGRWFVVSKVVLPLAMPGILTGIILSLARAIGETAPLLAIGAVAYISFIPNSLASPFTAMPIQIFNWISRPQPEFHTNAAAGIVVLMALMLCLNASAIILRMRLQRRI